MSVAISIRPAAAADIEVAREWLAAAQLPSADLTPAHMERFLLALDGDRPVGMIGLEQHGAVGLLRSLVVDPGRRAGGIGRQLVDALEKNAVERGAAELWLLTIDAEAYFAERGYTVRQRHEAPVAIQETPEFSTLCPGDAVLMSKRF